MKSILVNEIGIEILIAHYPPYTSKYNPIEHLMRNTSRFQIRSRKTGAAATPVVDIAGEKYSSFFKVKHRCPLIDLTAVDIYSLTQVIIFNIWLPPF
ncbi:hypothetical protein [Nostoc sp. NOS(2021)]|uniref:ISAzo13-like element transposase-related protein n=1 Tax=Nostoc sp. NOS(2021) TaxID=2815407 RepID=UPI00345AFD5B